MPVHLLSVAKTIVDMRLSKFDEKTSNPEEGKFDWVDKKYISYFSSPRPEYAFYWEYNNPKSGFQEVKDAKHSGGWEPLKYPQDSYFCEGATFTAEHTFTYGDLILMRRSLKREIEERIEQDKFVKANSGQSRIDTFTKERKAEGNDIPQELIDRMLAALQ